MNPAAQLAQEVKRRRHQLGLTQQDIVVAAEKAGGDLSIQTVQAIEAAKRESVRLRTARGLELALDWPEGTVQAVLDGKPPPDTPTTPATSPEPAPMPSLDVVMAELDALRNRVETLQRPDDDSMARRFSEWIDSLTPAQQRQLAELLLEWLPPYRDE